MNERRSCRPAWFLAPALLLSVVGCSAHLAPTPTELQAAYGAAIADARTAEPGEIDRRLWAVVGHDPRLVWQGEPGRSPLRVVTWTSWEGYDDRVGEPLTLEREVWVTLVPQLREYCRTIPSRTDRVLRLEQLLGLPPGNGKTRMVELWVAPEDLFRPCPDPEISDHECELDFPRSPRYVTVGDEHRSWFENLQQSSYGPDGYPWTRLGYTYDWGRPARPVGLSEYVVAAGSGVTVHAVTPTVEYCR